MDAVEDTCPLTRIGSTSAGCYQGLTYSAARQAMGRACKLAKIPTYTLHDLRHRRITLWHQAGVPARELAEWAGHARPSMLSLDAYTHVMPGADVDAQRLTAVLA